MGNGLPVDTVGMSVAAKADRRLVPILMASWFLLQLHRYGISFAALQITESFEMTGAQFGFVAGVLFLGCALFEGPSHFVLTRGGTPRGVGILILVSGVLNVGMAATSSVAGLAWMRFAMGVAQSACLPAMAQCLTPWLPGNLRRSAVASVGSMAMLAGVFGGPIAALAMVLNGVWDVSGWQWVFLLEGLPAVFCGLYLMARFPSKPERASWLNPAEKSWLSAYNAVHPLHQPRLVHGKEAIRDRRCWRFTLVFALMAFGSNALRMFQPVLLAGAGGLGIPGAAFLTGVPAAAGWFAAIHVTRHAYRMQENLWHIAIPLVASSVGLALVGTANGVVQVLTFASVASVSAASHLMLLGNSAAATAGHAAQIKIAVVNLGSLLGALCGPWILGALLDGGIGQMRAYGVTAVAVCVAAVFVVAWSTTLVPRVERRNDTAPP